MSPQKSAIPARRPSMMGSVPGTEAVKSSRKKIGSDPMPQALGQRMAQQERRPTDVRALVAELQAQAARLLEFSKEVEKQAERKGVNGYRDFQRLIMEFDCFSAVIENQLLDIRFRGKEDLRKRFDDVTLVVLSALVGAKLRYLSAFKTKKIPIGTKQLFAKELRAIRQAADRLTDPKHRARLSTEAGSNIKLAESVLEDIISRTEDLPRF